MAEMNEEAVYRSTRTDTGPDGSTTTTTTTSTQRSKDGSQLVTKQTKSVTKVSNLGGTSYTVTKTSAGSRSALTSSSGEDKPNQLGLGGGGATVTVQRSPSTIKQMMLDWCKAMTKEYSNVDIKNFSSSWNDGMAFCALIHHFYPTAFDYSKLDPKRRRGNFTLAFNVAEKLGGIAPLLEVDDMVRMKNPDWKCVFTYVQSIYRRFRDHDKNAAAPKKSGWTK